MDKKKLKELIFKIVETFSLDKISRDEYSTSLKELDIDSMDLLKIVLEIEKQLSIKILKTELAVANFYSIKTIVEFVSTKV